MVMLTPEQRRAVERAGSLPVRLEDPETRAAYILLRAEDYERLRAVAAGGVGLGESGDPQPGTAYSAIDEAFRAGWDDPKMGDYDDYETHRP